MRIFIHIDRKVDLAPFLASVPGNSGATFLQDRDRREINWGGFSQVEATLSLLNTSLSSRERFDRFCLLSGADFPIKGLGQIWNGFDSDLEFIRIDRRLNPSDDNTHCQNVRDFHFVDRPAPTNHDLSAQPRNSYDKISLYHGSQWWGLTSACIKYIIDFIDRNRDYVDFHAYTLCPDEIFFHSVVKHSPFATNITHDFEAVADLNAFFALNEHGCHYVDWTSRGVSLPKVLTEADFDALVGSEAYFARKFKHGFSDRLLELIEAATDKVR
jgi:hypothetical protein